MIFLHLSEPMKKKSANILLEDMYYILHIRAILGCFSAI